MAVTRFEFTKDWTRPEDFPPAVQSEDQARENIQALHNETRDYLNRVLVPELNRQGERKADAAALAGHTGNTSNPHKVTAQQVGAEPKIKGLPGQAVVLDESGRAVGIPLEQLARTVAGLIQSGEGREAWN